MTVIIHDTRRESHKLDPESKQARRMEILAAFVDHGEMTARECMEALKRHDMNEIRPRISELCGDGMLYACGKKYDSKTQRTVAVFRFNEGH